MKFCPSAASDADKREMGQLGADVTAPHVRALTSLDTGYRAGTVQQRVANHAVPFPHFNERTFYDAGSGRCVESSWL